MTFLTGILLIALGLGLMAFGLMLFYALLPLFYGLFGAGVGYWLGLVITGNTPLDSGLLELILTLVGAAVFALAAYFLEPARRIVVGIVGGVGLGFAVALALGAGNIITLILAVIGGVLGAIVLPMAFDPLIIITSAISGAAMVMDGAHMILPGVGLLDRFNIIAGGGGGLVTWLVWIIIAAIGLGWQFRNVEQWAKPELAA